jgi:hypothetical protein
MLASLLDDGRCEAPLHPVFERRSSIFHEIDDARVPRRHPH